MNKTFHIMCKPVCGVCNLDCTYCYYTVKPGELYPQVESFHMSDETLETYTRQYLDAQPQRCEFGWQGGEPLLAGKDFFRRAFDLQKTYRKEGQIITNGLQTNGTLLDEEWCDLLAEHNVLVGISLDGPAQWHDMFRKDRAGKPTFHRAWAGLELLKRRGVEFNVMVTLNSANAPAAGDIYRYFTNRGISYLQFIPILERTPDGNPTEWSCTPELFGRFMLDVFEIWARRDVGKVSERLIDCVLEMLVFGRPTMCCYASKCATAHVLEFNGDVYACDHFVQAQWKLGNIHETPLSELTTCDRLAEFAALKTELPTACRDCEFLQFCNAGCPKHHMPIGTDPTRRNYFCEGLKMFFREALPELQRMAPYLRQGQQPPPRDANPQQPPSSRPTPTASNRATKPGRNDPCPCGSGRKFKSCCGAKNRPG